MIEGDLEGQATSRGYTASRVHPSEYRLLSVIATTGSMMELLTQICAPPLSSSSAKLYRLVREVPQRCLDLLCCARSFTPTPVERAALRLIDYGALDVASLRFILEQELDALADRADAELDGQHLLGPSADRLSQ